MKNRKAKWGLLIIIGILIITGCSKEVYKKEKVPNEIHNAFLLYEEKYLDENERSVGDLYLITDDKAKEKISSGVLNLYYAYIYSQNKVLFINEENELYEYESGKEKNKLAENVGNFQDNFSKGIVTFQNEERDLFIINEEQNEEKISSRVSQYELIGNVIYYVDDDGDFSKYYINDKQETEIDSDVIRFTTLSYKDEVAYLNSDSALYYKEGDEHSIKITSDEVDSYIIKKIGSNLAYFKTEDEDSKDLYISPITKEGASKKIASDFSLGSDFEYYDGYYYYVNKDGNLYKKKENEKSSTKLASDVTNYIIENEAVFYSVYKGNVGKLFKIEDGKNSKKIASSVRDYNITPKGDVVYTTDDRDLFINNKKVASEIEDYNHYYGNLAFVSEEKLYLMEDMGETKIVEDKLSQYSTVSYQNISIYDHLLTFEDIAGVWETENNGEKLFLEFDKNGGGTFLNTDKKGKFDTIDSKYKSIKALTQDGTDYSFYLYEDNTLVMENGNGYVATLKRTSKANADEYSKKLQAEAENQTADLVESNKDDIVWATYYNERFGFTINYPQEWTLGPEPTNGDGRPLHQGSNVEILAYASNYMEEFKPDISSYEKLTTNFGEDAYLMIQNNGSEIELDGIIFNNGIEFHLTGTMNSAFYQKYSIIFREMIFIVKFD